MIYQKMAGPVLDFVFHKRKNGYRLPSTPLCGVTDDKIIIVVHKWSDTDCKKCLALKHKKERKNADNYLPHAEPK